MKTTENPSEANRNPTLQKKDHCALCGKESPYDQSTHIDYRIGYIEGAGQACFQPDICPKNP